MDKSKGKDIYVFDLPVEKRPLTVTYMKGTVFDERNGKPLKAEFELTDLETGIMIFNAFSDSITGEFLVSIPVNRNYMLNVSRRSYLFYSENFSLKNVFVADRPYMKDIPLQPVIAGSRVILKNVFFETDSYFLRNESRIELGKVVGLLKANPDIKIEIGGHTDATGSADYNQILSENRAKAVADYLIASDIHPARIRWKGYGFNVPVAGNESAEGRSQNRRTEMMIIE
jgi:outer membrane protein OmpA-like peptidoglycan-associated protein